jgi:short-subunit dehydrogenase
MKNILITGASGNLGRTIVAAFEQADEYHINIISREEVQGSNHLKAFHVDLLDEVSAALLVEEIIETQHHIDAVIFLTGGYVAGDITANSAADIQKMISVNVATAHNIASPLININRHQKRKLSLVFIGAKAAMELSSAINNIAYALSKKTLYHYVSLINESENKAGTSAYILLPGTLDTSFNRNAMPNADFTVWTKPGDIASYIRKIVDGVQTENVIEL